MRRGAHRSRPKSRDSAQIQLDFGAPGSHPALAVATTETSPRAVAEVIPIASRRPRGGAETLPPPAPGGPERTADECFELGFELEATAGEEARSAYHRALELEPGHVGAHLNLGRLLHESGDLRGAERHYRLALEADPAEATAAFNLGVVLEDLRRELEAIAAYERALAADPDFLDAYHNAARLHERRGDKPAALRVLKRLRERTR